MNGFGHFLLRVRAFQAYWAAAALLLAVAAYLFWVRGTTADWRGRARASRAGGSRGPSRRSSGVGAVAMVGARRLHLLQHQRPQPLPDADDQQARQADYEKKYKALAADAAAQDHGGQGRRRPLPARAAVRMRGSYALENKTGKPIDTVHLLVLPGRADDGRQARVRRAGRRSRPTTRRSACAATSWRRRSRRARRPTLAFDLDDRRRTASPTPARTPTSSTTASFVNGQSAAADHRLPGRAASSPTDRDRKKFGLPPSERMRDRDDPAGLAENALVRRRRLHHVRGDGRHRRRPVRDRAGLPAEGVDGGRPPLLRVQDGQPDPQLLRVPVGALRGEEGPLERRRDRDLLPARARVQPRPDDRGDQGRARLLHGRLRALPAQAVPDHRVPALRRRSRSRSPTRFPYSEGIGFIARVRDGRPGGHRLSVLRDRARARAPVVGPPGGRRQRAGRDDAGRDAGAVLGADGDEAEVRRGEDAALPAVRARPLPAAAAAPSRRRSCRCRASRTRPYIHYRKGSLVMYALQDYIGEDNLNRAIRAFRDEHGVQGPAVPEHDAAARAHPRGDAAAAAVRHRRHVRDDHALRQPRDRAPRRRRCPTAATRSR